MRWHGHKRKKKVAVKTLKRTLKHTVTMIINNMLYHAYFLLFPTIMTLYSVLVELTVSLMVLSYIIIANFTMIIEF